jgi:hypothetical protein
MQMRWQPAKWRKIRYYYAEATALFQDGQEGQSLHDRWHEACAGIEGSVGVCDRGRVARLSLELGYGRAGSLFVMGT